MKKLMIFLASLTLTTTGTSMMVACNQTDKKGEIKDYTGVPNANSIKEKIRAEGYNPNDLDVDMQEGMKTAIIRFMPDAENIPFYSKTINLNWSTNDISKIITSSSMPPFKDNIDINNPDNLELFIKTLNLFNGTQFTLNDVNVVMEGIDYKVSAVTSGNFQGEIIIHNEAITFGEMFSLTNLGTIYIPEDKYNKWLGDPSGNIAAIASFLMEYAGDRNRLAEPYKDAIMAAFITSLGKLIINIDDNTKKGTFILPGTVENIILDSKVTFNFTVSTTPRVFLNENGIMPNTNATIKVNLTKNYTENNIAELRYDVVTKLLGQEFADKYNNLFYDEIIKISNFGDVLNQIIIAPKIGSKIFAISDLLSSVMTGIPSYKIEVTFNTEG